MTLKSGTLCLVSREFGRSANSESQRHNLDGDSLAKNLIIGEKKD